MRLPVGDGRWSMRAGRAGVKSLRGRRACVTGVPFCAKGRPRISAWTLRQDNDAVEHACDPGGCVAPAGDGTSPRSASPSPECTPAFMAAAWTRLRERMSTMTMPARRPSNREGARKKSPGGGPGLGWRSAGGTDEEGPQIGHAGWDTRIAGKFRTISRKIMNTRRGCRRSRFGPYPPAFAGPLRLSVKPRRCYHSGARRGGLDLPRVLQNPGSSKC